MNNSQTAALNAAEQLIKLVGTADIKRINLVKEPVNRYTLREDNAPAKWTAKATISVSVNIEQ